MTCTKADGPDRTARAEALGRSWRLREPDPVRLAMDLGIRIDVHDRGIAAAGVLIGECFPSEKRIVVYSDALDALRCGIERSALNAALPVERLRDVAIAHELYHYMQFASKEPASEDGAHAFVSAYLCIDTPQRALDAVFCSGLRADDSKMSPAEVQSWCKSVPPRQVVWHFRARIATKSTAEGGLKARISADAFRPDAHFDFQPPNWAYGIHLDVDVMPGTIFEANVRIRNADQTFFEHARVGLAFTLIGAYSGMAHGVMLEMLAHRQDR